MHRIDDLDVTPGGDVAFTRREMEVLQYLAAHAGRPVPREELLHKVWGYARHLEIETRTVDIHIAKLRRKIEPDPREPRAHGGGDANLRAGGWRQGQGRGGAAGLINSGAGAGGANG